MDYASVLIEENRRFADLVRSADPATPVPTCPGWSLVQLLRHVGRGDRWAAQIVADRMDDFLDPRAVRGGKPPQDPAGALEWLHGSSRALVDAVAQVGARTPVWTFIGPRPASWWIRRRLHEWTVHRADAALALGADYRLAAPLAVDGLSEWLDLLAARRGGESASPLAPGVTLHLHATDEGLDGAGEWLVRGEPGGVSWQSAHDKADAAMRGPATELLLLLLRRRPLPADGDGDVEIFGDPGVLTTWLDRTGF